MTPLALNQQIDNHGQSMGVCSFAAGCRGYRSAGQKRQDTRRIVLPRRVGSHDLPVTNWPGLRRPGPSRVGWVFTSARDFLDFHALTRSGIQPLHASALLGSPSLQIHPSFGIDPCAAEPMIEPLHLERLSIRLADGNNHSEATNHAAGPITQGLGNA